jgi:hypothetical protein
MQQRTFKEHLLSNLSELGTWRVFAMPVGVFLIVLIKSPEHFLPIYLALIKSPLALGIWIVGATADLILRAIYWHARERNPTYIKKQEAYEKWKAEKDLKKSLEQDKTGA